MFFPITRKISQSNNKSNREEIIIAVTDTAAGGKRWMWHGVKTTVRVLFPEFPILNSRTGKRSGVRLFAASVSIYARSKSWMRYAVKEEPRL